MRIGYGNVRYCACVILLVLVTVIGLGQAARVPGVKWGLLEVWEDSAKTTVRNLVTEYFSFRKYAFDRLSDAGYFDHLLTEVGGLRIIEGTGGATGILVTLVVGEVARRRGRSADQQGNEPLEDEFGIPEVKVQAWAMMQRMLREGPIMRVFRQTCAITTARQAVGNVLTASTLLDNRYRPRTENIVAEVRVSFVNWTWNLTKSFWENWSSLELLAQALVDHVCHVPLIVICTRK